MSTSTGHNVFECDGVTFSSNFDNGNLARVERLPGGKPYEFKIWIAPDNMGSTNQSKHCAWFYFMVTGLPGGSLLRIQIANASNHSGLYKYDMRPVYKSNTTNQKWVRIKNSVKFSKQEESGSAPQLFFEHQVEVDDDKLSFAFTYPYTYAMVQQELESIVDSHENDLSDANSVYCIRELLTRSCDGRRIDLITVTSPKGYSLTREPLMPGLFPDPIEGDPEYDRNGSPQRPPIFPEKEVVFVSARVHAGEVPAQHAFKGIFNLLMDPKDLRARELRKRYVFKMIPMLNPDGVYRGHFRMDQHGQNLNRYYTDPDPYIQPSIFAAKSLLDMYATTGKLALYLDFHAHASKRGCFIYGNVMDSVEEQVQNQLFCRLIAMNSPHFDYDGCLFSRDHMTRIDPGDQEKGLTAEGSGRVATFLSHGLIHSYTLECNYNTGKTGNEIAALESDPGGSVENIAASPFTANPEKYTPTSFAGVGRACVIALLDIRGHNPCSRIPRSKMKSLERVRLAVFAEVKTRKEYKGQSAVQPRRLKTGDDSSSCTWKAYTSSRSAPFSSIKAKVASIPSHISAESDAHTTGKRHSLPINSLSSDAVADLEKSHTDGRTSGRPKVQRAFSEKLPNARLGPSSSSFVALVDANSIGAGGGSEKSSNSSVALPETSSNKMNRRKDIRPKANAGRGAHRRTASVSSSSAASDRESESEKASSDVDRDTDMPTDTHGASGLQTARMSPRGNASHSNDDDSHAQSQSDTQDLYPELPPSPSKRQSNRSPRPQQWHQQQPTSARGSASISVASSASSGHNVTDRENRNPEAPPKNEHSAINAGFKKLPGSDVDDAIESAVAAAALAVSRAKLLSIPRNNIQIDSGKGARGGNGGSKSSRSGSLSERTKTPSKRPTSGITTVGASNGAAAHGVEPISILMAGAMARSAMGTLSQPSSSRFASLTTSIPVRTASNVPGSAGGSANGFGYVSSASGSSPAGKAINGGTSSSTSSRLPMNVAAAGSGQGHILPSSSLSVRKSSAGAGNKPVGGSRNSVPVLPVPAGFNGFNHSSLNANQGGFVAGGGGAAASGARSNPALAKQVLLHAAGAEVVRPTGGRFWHADN